MDKFKILAATVLLVGIFLGLQAHAATYTLYTSDDTTVVKQWPTTNYDVSGGISTQYAPLFDYTSYAYFKFNLSGIPSGEVITGAVLNLKQYWGSGNEPHPGDNYGTNLYRIADDSWTETTITWANQPAGGTFLDNNPNPGSYIGWSSWNLFPTWAPATDQADGFLSLQLRETEEYTQAHSFYNGESYTASENRPYLIVTTLPSPNNPSVPEPTTMLLLGLGLIGLVGLKRKLRK